MVKTAVGILAHGYLNRYLLSLKSFTRTAFPSLCGREPFFTIVDVFCTQTDIMYKKARFACLFCYLS